MSTPTSRTLERCRRLGYTACVVEKWIPQTRRRKDAFGFGDVLVARPPQQGALLIQACSGGDGAKRVAKIQEECRDEAEAWLAAGNSIEVWAWRKRGRFWEPLITCFNLPRPEVDLGDVLDNLPF